MSSGGGGELPATPKNKDGVPQWNGDPAAFQQYEEECYLWEQTQQWHKRSMCAPRLKSELTGAAKRLILGQPADWTAHPDGVTELMKFLRIRLGRPQMPELSELLLKYFRGSRRKNGESINDFVTRKCEAYMRAQQALARITKDRQPHQVAAVGTTNPATSDDYWDNWSRPGWSRRTSVESEEVETAFEEGPPQAAAPTGGDPTDGEESTRWRPSSWQWSGYGGWNGYSWSGGWGDGYWQPSWTWSSATSSSNSCKPKASIPDIIPDFVQGWFLLMDANLDIHERNGIQTALQGDFGLQRVASELRAQWPDSEILRRDRSHRGASYWSEGLEEGEGLEDELGFSVDAAWRNRV
eukprot:s1951_g5.t1